jgi:phage baseplate assembly protein W
MTTPQRVIETYVGKGIIFPIELDSLGKPVIKTGFELIRASIIALLSWPRGTRMFLEQYGSRLEDLLEEQNTVVAKNLVAQFIRDSIDTFEKRITLKDVSVTADSFDKFSIKLTYTIRNSNLQDSFIFPFYTKIAA